jgi:diaminohydroxyphosphoribosylaminopyrimidine deaminase/5-amino-6-(5-phosphoribosylamino)uracil reductase
LVDFDPAVAMPVPIHIDLLHLERALELARGRWGATRPNPTVGCVIVGGADGRTVIGEAAHERAGQPHAEPAALSAAREAGAVKGATAYVSLEPCNHEGRTPACSNVLIEAGIRRVVYAVHDPNPTAGGGAAALRGKKIRVDGPEELARSAAQASSAKVSADDADADPAADPDRRWRRLYRECREINAPFLSRHERGRPFIVAKWAMSADGKIATRTGASKWISSPEARADAMEWRARLGAVAVGAGTARADDPALTYRGERDLEQPVRVIFNRDASVVGADTRLITKLPTAPLVVVAEEGKVPPEREKALLNRGASLVYVPAGHNGLLVLEEALPALLQAHDVDGLLFEGGSALIGAAFASRVVDRALIYMAPKFIGGRDAPGPVGNPGVDDPAGAWRGDVTDVRTIGADHRFTVTIDGGFV